MTVTRSVMRFSGTGPIGHHTSDEPQTDFAAINEGYVSITPLSLDMTAQRHTDTLTEWLDQKNDEYNEWPGKSQKTDTAVD